MQHPINLFEQKDLKVLKVIRIVGPYWNLFTGFILYSRPFSKTYNSDTSDLLDIEILNAIKKQFPDSNLVINKEIFFVEEYESIKKMYSNGHAFDFTITFLPQVSHGTLNELLEKKIYGYSQKFPIRLMFHANNEKINEIQHFSMVYIAIEQYAEFEKLLKTLIVEI